MTRTPRDAEAIGGIPQQDPGMEVGCRRAGTVPVGKRLSAWTLDLGSLGKLPGWIEPAYDVDMGPGAGISQPRVGS